MLTHTSLWVSLFLFCVATLFTPGPNNLMLMRVGLVGGFRKSWESILGVAFGFALFILSVGLGLGHMIQEQPQLAEVLRLGGIAYTLYLAWSIACTSAVPTQQLSQRRTTRFWPILVFQWVNPKGWMMALTTTSTYSPLMSHPVSLLCVALIFGATGLFSSLLWVGIGFSAQKAAAFPVAFRLFNWSMACFLCSSLLPLLKPV